MRGGLDGPQYPGRHVFLKSLTLKGFKSFADTTSLEFEPGITVVVGPNGSGKSNLVDAVAWVLGAQGPRTLRSTKMEDVIFAGTGKRPALGRAEVSLTIDNSAALLPIEFSEVTITRTLWRSGESEYALNGVPCRLLDVQELLSDTGVGRQQHVIVGQGQLDTVLSARPEDRRLIVEEAAGVLKYRRRREKAQRRLEATEGNLLRLQDLLREVRRQLRPLERQAEAARRHGDLAAELTALRLHLAGRDITGLESRLAAMARTRAELGQEEDTVRQELARLDADVLAAESEMTVASGAEAEALGDAAGKLEGLRERARGLSAVLTERRRSVERDLRASVDEGVVASLEAEAARLAVDLERVDVDAAELAPLAEALASAEAELHAQRAAFEAAEGDAHAAAGTAAELRGELTARRAALVRDRSELARLESRLAALQEREGRLSSDTDRSRAELRAAEEAEQPLVNALVGAERRRTEAQDRVERVAAGLREAEHDQHSWVARADALALALDEARARAGAERLAGVPGVVGTLVELVEVDAGWEAAFQAAAGEAVAAVVVDGVDSARDALTRLREAGATGAVLPAEAARVPGSLALSAAALEGAEPVRAHVRSGRPGVERLLDGLLATAVAVEGGWTAALDLALAHPGLIAVTREGDRFTSTGWRTGAAGPRVTGAALEEARRRAAEASEKVARVAGEVSAGQRQLEGARAAEAELSRSLDANDTRLSAAADAVQRLEAERRDLSVEREGVATHVDELRERLRCDEERVAELEAALPSLDAEESAGSARREERRAGRSLLEDRAAEAAGQRRDLEVRRAGLEERRALLARRLEEIEERLRDKTEQRQQAAARRRQLEGVATAVERLTALVADRALTLDSAWAEVKERRRLQHEATRARAERLDGLRRERSTAERRLAELRERTQRLELDEAEARLRLEAAVESVRRDLDREPEAARDAPCPELPPGTSPANRVRELERELRVMGPVNPLALEEFDALQERHRFLEEQLEDVKAGRRELAKVIRAIDAEIVDVFAAAYADVADNFSKLFATLFSDGTGRLRLTDPDDLLNTGIEVEARPSGKNVRKLSLLSGGERSLTALAFLFAVFRSRPSPFYLLDEVEAALDDVNLHRFLDLIHEFRAEAQLVIVSHQKRTMEAADCLYGVTMQPGASSKVISERVRAGA